MKQGPRPSRKDFFNKYAFRPIKLKNALGVLELLKNAFELLFESSERRFLERFKNLLKRVKGVKGVKLERARAPAEELVKRGLLVKNGSASLLLFKEGKPAWVFRVEFEGRPTAEAVKLLRRFRELAQKALERIERDLLSALCFKTFRSGRLPMALLDGSLRLLRVNESFARLLGASPEELEGRSLNELAGKSVDAEGGRLELSYGKRKVLLEVSLTPITHEGSTYYSLLARDLSYELALERRVRRLSTYDPKTGALNREAFIEEAEKVISAEPDRYHALLVLDVRNFSEINRVYGPEAGDEVLKELLRRLRGQADGPVGRLGADEFGLFMPRTELPRLPLVINLLLEKLRRPVEVNGRRIPISLNAGAAVYPYDGRSARELLEKAFVALKRAKEEGENAYKFFSAKFQEEAERYVRVRSLLTEAFLKNELKLYYQPVYACPSGKVAGFEALLRIEHEGSVISPSEFIELLELSELALQVDLRNLSRLRSFFERLPRKVFLSMNVSPKSLQDSRFIEALKELPASFRKHLVLEITERTLAQNLRLLKEVLELLDGMGLRVFIDDFGTGYASFSYLDELPVKGLKVDRSFIRKLDRPRTRAVVKTVLSVGKELGMEVVAEGVEKKSQWEQLRSLGCDLVQGFYFAPPLPEKEAIKALRAS
ncbi:MAG: EAL domain-containing protein [Aquificae bacterium]|nr:EAL domain-containing protein [Aquificota bacterium]